KRYARTMRYASVFIVCSLLLCATAAAQQVYRWVDENGVVHYSDQPPPNDGAETVELDVPEGFSNPAQRIARGESTRRAINRDDDVLEAVGSYRRATITTPEPQQVLWNIATNLSVSMTLEPALAGSHRIQWLLDGQPIGEPVLGLQTTLTPVFRGTHTLTANVVDSQGTTVFSTAPVTFYVQQATIRGRR
ncbi:MAG: DUF4124 domain-containing protein, partial [Pseudomonadota bacterium]